MMKKRKMLEYKKEPDKQAIAALAEKKSKLQEETIVAPSESEIDLGVFSEKIGKNIQVCFRFSSWWRMLVLVLGGMRPMLRVWKLRFSQVKLLLRHLYTKRMRSFGGGGASSTHQSPKFHRVQGGSWTTHNPACDDLPYAPHWTLIQGSRMNDLSNCREFYSLSLPLLRGFSRKTATVWIFWMIISMPM
ncbi:hypothetical protein Hdeb2414_s0006g00201851 [Helianthus debilis subsp. tardiflorus]